MLHALSTLVVMIVFAGVMARKRPAIHLPLMVMAFVIDLSLVLYIEVTRHAVERVVGPAGPLIWFHASISTLVLLAYLGQITLGRRMLAGRATSRRAHIALGLTFCVLRGTNYVTAFMVSSAAPAAVLQQAADSHPADTDLATTTLTPLPERE
ncbi:MAG: hypothetical protein WC815_03195 [Vicinamibacterales bacterium]|jgi:hypothetical protein